MSLANLEWGRTTGAGRWMPFGGLVIDFPLLILLCVTAGVGGVVLYSALGGGCWLRRAADTVRLEHGDVLLLSGDEQFVLASDATLPVLDMCPVFESQPEALTAPTGGALLVGVISLDPAQADLITSVLPPFVHLRSSSSEATALRWLLERIEREQRTTLPGAHVASTELAQLVSSKL